MELNAEQIIDFLDKMDFFQGQRAGRELWGDKPFDVQEQDIANFSRDISLIKKYISSQEQKIKELTEENERLIVTLKMNGAPFPEGLQIVHDFCEKGKRKAKADTVRKMQERLKEAFEHRGLYGVDAIERRIDQIAKEVLDGNTASDNKCVVCGDIIPEGRQVCPNCEEGEKRK